MVTPASSIRTNTILSPFENTAEVARIKICGYLNHTETTGLCLVSKTIKDVADKDLVWKTLFLRSFPNSTLVPTRPVKHQFYHEQVVNPKVVRSNVANLRCIIKTFRASENQLKSVELHNGRIFTLTLTSKELIIWEDKDNEYKEVQRFDDVRSFAVQNGHLFIINSKGLRICEDKGNGLFERIQGHAGVFSCIKSYDNRLFINDRTDIKIWKMHDGNLELMQTVNCGHLIYRFDIVAGHIFAFYDPTLTLKFFEESDGFKTLRTLTIPDGSCDVKVHNGRFYVKCISAHQVWGKKGEDYELVETLSASQIEFNNGLSYLAKSGSDYVEIQDERSSLINTLSFPGVPSCLTFKEGKLFSGNHEGFVKVWNFSATKKEVFQQLAGLFDTPGLTPGDIQFLKYSRLLKMPKKDVDKILGKLFIVMAPKRHYSKCDESAFQQRKYKYAERAFLGKNGKSCTPAQIAKAIRLFLEDGKEKPHPKPSNTISSSPSLAHKTHKNPK